MAQNESQKVKITIPLILGICALVFGVTGFMAEAFKWDSMLNWLRSSTVMNSFMQSLAKVEHAIYKTFQIAQFEYDTNNYGNLVQNPFLFFARWLAPLALIWTAVRAYFQLRREGSQIKKIKKWKDHTIICGYGEIGKRVVQSLLDDNKKTVVIDPGIEKDHFVLQDKSDCFFIKQDANIDTSLERAGLFKADYLIAVTGNDLMNFSILSTAKAVLKPQKSEKCLSAFAHVSNHELIANVQDYPLFQITEEYFDGRVFNADNLASRLVFKQHAPDIYSPVTSNEQLPVHIILFGFNQFAQSLVTQFGRTAHFLTDVKTQITVIDSEIDQKKETYLGRYQAINQLIDLELIHRKSDCLKQEDVAAFKNKAPVSVIYLCHEDNIVQALTLNRIREIWKNEVHVVVCQSETMPVPDWVSERNNYHVLNPFTSACSYKIIFEESLERLAEKFHNLYLRDERERFLGKCNEYEQTKAKDKTVERPKPKAAMVEWGKLSEEYKQSNRSLADHLDVKLRAIGCEACMIEDERPEAIYPSGTNIINQLANMEHRRWNANHLLSGWQYGSERNDTLKIHDNLVPWEELSDEIKEYDIQTIINIPTILKSEEFNMKICKFK